ncbi:MAG TPA: Spy/CpxP family protein refolding chaperone [Bryobacteraceae bacterium]|jgi:Spy/CpxP family protein refolding chaperone|nr:Spy/CpxP family protein refolding chaperone [Bryobacteraceae bacterium]
MIKVKIQICAIALLTGALLCGQTAPTPPSAAQMAEWRVNHLTSALSLTTAQQSQAKTIFSTEASSNAGLRASMEAAHKALEAAIETNDASAIAAQATQIGNLTAQETQARATADAALFAILNADQQTKYKEMLSHGPGRRGGPGHGFGADGPMPPPPPGD